MNIKAKILNIKLYLYTMNFNQILALVLSSGWIFLSSFVDNNTTSSFSSSYNLVHSVVTLNEREQN